MSPIPELLLELFRSHDVDAILQDDWIVFPQNRMKVTASVGGEFRQPAGMSVQLDVMFAFAPGRMIVESFGGIGETRETAIADALRSFAANSFHVLLAAFLRPGDEQAAQQVTREEWSIGGATRRVTLGAALRGKPPTPAEAWTDCLQRFLQRIQGTSLSPETHWLRLYYGQAQGKVLSFEVLLDNEVWPEMQSEIAALDWPAGEEFYSVRVFLVVAGEDEEGITPERAVAYLVEMLASHPNLTDDELFQAMAEAGIPDRLADRAYQFTQTAWGRLFLEQMKIDLSSDYFCFDAAGNVVETGRLADEPYFAEAARLGPRYHGTPAFLRLALSSADVDGVNNALKADSKPENLVTGPAGVFVEEPTSAGLQNAQQVIRQYIASRQEQTAPEKEAQKPQARPSRWQFWKR